MLWLALAVAYFAVLVVVLCACVAAGRADEDLGYKAKRRGPG